ADQKVDELAEKLKELAKRQQQEAERQRRLAQAGQQQQSGSGGAAQRQLAQEAEEAARRLEQLSREQQRPDLAQAARDLQQLADRKEAMDAKVGELQKDLEKLANDTRRDERDASRKLDEAAGSIRDKKVREKIRYTKGTLQQSAGSQSQYARAMEDDIKANLD